MSDPAQHTFTVGTHNVHDNAGEPTIFADVGVFTEAIAHRIREKTRQLRGFGYGVAVCRRQPDLVVVYRRKVFRRSLTNVRHYRKFVDGIAKVTPNRGTYSVPLVHKASGRLVWVNAEHRINAAFPPFVRGEGWFRETAWQRHATGTLEKMRRQMNRGAVVIGAGDVNTPRTEDGYPGFHEIGAGYDRIGASVPLTDVEHLTRKGSDHGRLKATAVLR